MIATITYNLSEAGQKASLIAGGDGKSQQTVSIEITPEQVDLFDINNGTLSADCRKGATRSGSSWEPWRSHEFATIPTAEELVGFLVARSSQRQIVEAEEAREKAEKAERDKQEAAIKRTAAIATLTEALTSGTVIQPSWHTNRYLNIDGVQLSDTDADSVEPVSLMLARAEIARSQAALHEEHMKAIKAIASVAKIRPTTPLPNNQYAFDVPSSGMREKDWAKHVSDVDTSKTGGYAFSGSWLTVGKTEELPNGSLVLVGGSQWEGSRKRGETVYKSLLYLVTPAGLRLIDSGTDEAKKEAAKYLALDPDARVQKLLKKVAKDAAEAIAKFDALDATEYHAEAEEILTRRTSWAELQTLCETALAGGLRYRAPEGEEPEPEPEPVTPLKPTRAYHLDEPITDMLTAADAIIAAGYKSLARKHKDSAEIMEALRQAKQQLQAALNAETTDAHAA